MSPEQLKAIKDRLAKTSPGPWRTARNRHPTLNRNDWGWIEGPLAHWVWTDDKPGQKEDATFIAHAKQDVPALVERVEALERELVSEYELSPQWRQMREERDALKRRVERMEDAVLEAKDMIDVDSDAQRVLSRALSDKEADKPVIDVEHP